MRADASRNAQLSQLRRGTSTDEPLCHFCGSRLATVACPSCFGMIFVGSKHCPRCGAAAVVPTITAEEEIKCPRCKAKMKSVAIGSTNVSECEECLGLWLNVAAFEKICADREQQSAVLGSGSPAPSSAVRETSKVNYVPCPQCSQLSNRDATSRPILTAPTTSGGGGVMEGTGFTVLDSMEIFTCSVSPCGSPSPTPTTTGRGAATRRLLLPRR